jgi:hypothetical protein
MSESASNQTIFRKWEAAETRHKLLDAPRYGAKSAVEVTDVLHAGVVYLAKPVPEYLVDEPLKKIAQEEKVVLKVIYSGIAFEQYGAKVHAYLEEKDMAPKYFFCLDIGSNLLPTDPIEQHHVMEYLPPPSNDSAGWISLLELEEKFPEVASIHKSDIEAALYKIINVLGEKKYVHGDLRPNNLLIKVTTGLDGCKIQNREGSDPLPCLKVIDFDWAGKAGAVKYPPHRNPDVEWPGESGKPISDSHDKLMIDTWLSKWPHLKDADAECGRGGDGATSIRVSHSGGDVAMFVRVSQPSL